MEWIFHAIDNFFASFIWRSLLSQFKWVDWFTIAMVVVGLFYGLKRGLMREIVEILESILLIYVVLEYCPQLTNFLRKFLSKLPEAYIQLVAFILLAFLVWYVIHFIDQQISKLFQTKTAGALKALGGLVLGMAHVLLLWSFMSQALLLLPNPDIRTAYSAGGSKMGRKISEIAPKTHDLIQDIIARSKK